MKATRLDMIRHLGWISQDLPNRYSSDGRACLYRHGARRCIVGAFIPDDEYREWMDGKPVTVAAIWRVVEKSFHGVDMDFAFEMQNIHDRLGGNDLTVNEITRQCTHLRPDEIVGLAYHLGMMPVRPDYANYTPPTP